MNYFVFSFENRARDGVALVYWTNIGQSLRARGFLTKRAKRELTQNWESPTCLLTRPSLGPVLPQTTWGGRILTLHLNYVASYTGPLLFLFELTHKLSHNYPVRLWCFVWSNRLGNRYGPGVSSLASQGNTLPRLRLTDVHPHPEQWLS